MRIGCLQFAPQLGDVDNNLYRADAVLSRANPQDLDVLVLPECAFSGYNFKSLSHISSFLEHSGSGISSLWARTTALKYNCTVAVGYPEQIDLREHWPASPEYYNSLIVVSPGGETIANYRKTHLYYTDERWALEGSGFFQGYVQGLGWAAIGICMDLNPYRFEAPWDEYEFACHVLDSHANVVVLSMAWLTREDARTFSRTPKEPDMDTMTYWITRLEPLIRRDEDSEIIVIFCNRTGVEDDAVYAGTSAVIGIRHGEVNVYGLLGRGEKELLVVDTEKPAFAKLVHRSTSEAADGADATQRLGEEGKPANKPEMPPQMTATQPEARHQQPHGPKELPDEPDSFYRLPNAGLSPNVGRAVRPRVTIPSTKPAGLGAVEEYPTPTAPSPTPANVRPQLDIPSAAPRDLPHQTRVNPKLSEPQIEAGEQYYVPHLGQTNLTVSRADWRQSIGSAHSGSNLDYVDSVASSQRTVQPVSYNSPRPSSAARMAKELTLRPSRTEMSQPKPSRSRMPESSWPSSSTTRDNQPTISRGDSRTRARERSTSAADQSTRRDRFGREADHEWDQPISAKRLESYNTTQFDEVETPQTLYNRRIENMSTPMHNMPAAHTGPRRPQSTIPSSGKPAEMTPQRPSRASSYSRHGRNAVANEDRRPQSRTTERQRSHVSEPPPPRSSEVRRESRGRTRDPKYLAAERSSSAHSTRPEPPTSRENSRERPVLNAYDPDEIVAVQGTISPRCPVHSGSGTPANTSRTPSNQGRASSSHARNPSNQRRPSSSVRRMSSKNHLDHVRTQSRNRASPTTGRSSAAPMSPPSMKSPVPDSTSNSAIARYLKTATESPSAEVGPVETLITLVGDSPSTTNPEREPLTPKAMILMPEDEASAQQPRPLRCLDKDVASGGASRMTIERPRSAVS